jgi:chromosome segregation protein
MSTYEKINTTFMEKFVSLSTKGEATLELEDPATVFEGGVNIKVRLTGKKFLDIRSLSGGEKTMTALAFLFSVQDHEPATFYVLDEVDAALDKRNSEKLAQLVRQYVSKAQYLVISHNDGLIAEADNLYGVSMNQDGISKVVSLKV